jgi:hypothetical protein
MVTSTGPQEIDENIEIITTETPEEQAPGGDEVATEGEATEESPAETPDTGGGQPSEARLLEDTAPQQPQPAQPQVDQKAIQELQQRRVAEQEQMWRSKVSKAARTYQQQLEESGYMPEQAKDQAKRYVQQERKFRQQDAEAAGMIGHIQGRHMAAVHYMKKHGLANDQVLNDLTTLQNTASPAEMDKAAKRIKEDRALRTENAQLKQGRVAPQTFDNSQGSAEATTNQNRLLDAYLAGDRSDAAVRAAKSQTFGS